MTIFLTPEELSNVLVDSPLIRNSAEAIGWKNFKVFVYPSMEAERNGFEIDVEEVPEVEAL